MWNAYFWFAVLLLGGSAIARTALYFLRPGAVSLYDVVLPLAGLPVLVALWEFIHNQPFSCAPHFYSQA